MTANELRQLYINFFTERGHRQIASASLIPENDPSVLFTTAGMHPLVPYLLGEKHPLGRRLADCQKCLRTGDIDSVGDAYHCTFFEMLGNWSLGDYFKKESITFSHEFLTIALKFPQEKISVTCFAGDADAPRDEEAADIWRSLGYPDERINFLPKSDNWWGPAGITGPCGPDTEIFYDTGKPKCGPDCRPGCHCGKYVEIWNNVFMQYFKDEFGKFSPLSQKNVDTGFGLERNLCIQNGVESVYDTELFVPVIKKAESLTGKKYADNLKAFRIIADHLRAATFILGDDRGIAPSNVDQGYVLRRLIRRAYRYLTQMNAPANAMSAIAQVIVDNYKEVYPELGRNHDFVIAQLNREEELFGRTLEAGMKIANKYLDGLIPPSLGGGRAALSRAPGGEAFNDNDKASPPAPMPGAAPLQERGELPAELAFKLYDTYGFPLEFTEELARERNISVDADGFHKLFAAHQEKSRAGAEQKFKGGLADHSEETTKLHTAAHLMNGALRRVLGDTVFQKGSNITAERLRFDFSSDRKVTPEELAEVERIVNEAIAAAVPVVCTEMSPADAHAAGAVGVFDSKYGDVVKVYSIEGYSKEICGGPHAANTADLGAFKIQKEESIAAGVRRIKAVIGDAAK
ncbi:MAG: alanine--tRNA ligase [Proteobacteria bacterium]|nr:alanine--tRNA ligase [Pseudomonadota bacterium]